LNDLSNPHPVTETAWSFQAARWETNSLVVERAGHALVTDPTFSAREIGAIAAKAGECGPDGVHVLVTHSHFDHVCGVAYFEDAEIVIAADTSALFESGDAARQLAVAAREWGTDWPCTLRYDRAVAAGERFRCGPFTIEAIRADGNSGDGVGYALLDEGILVSADFLAAACLPTFDTSLASAIATCSRMLGALERLDLEWVLPGHGPLLTPEEARAVGEADLRYLELLHSTAREQLDANASEGDALVALYAVEPPRGVLPDFAIYSPRVTNARATWWELTGRRNEAAALNRHLGER
jgi:glyoxylase-like metal-dependent hydrolase (beta-lactamase superfamily II)